MATTTEMANAIEPPATECRPLMIECWPPRTGLRQRPSVRQARFDMLTGAPRRGPGLADMQREIDRANRGNGRLIVAYVDVNGLKATNDSEGHHAGDVILKHMVNVVQNLCSYGSVVRLGGDEFVCTISDTTIENVRERFDEITAQLSLTPDDGSISVGFAQLVRGDSPLDLIDRADRGLIASRDTQSRNRRTGI
jgi:diguanylate cyclase (GGDEF)-like protein